MGDKEFRMHNSIIPFTTKDVSLILGLEDKGNKLALKNSTVGGLQERLFLTSDEITRIGLENKIYQFTDSYDADDVVDTYRMVVVHLLCSFLLARRNHRIGDVLYLLFST